MPVKYFYRELVNNGPIYDHNGTIIPWEPLSNWDGVCQVDDEKNPALVEDLRKIIGTRGVTEIQEGEYSSKKETHPFRGYPEKSSGVKAFSPPQLGRPKVQEAAVVVENNPPPAAPPATEPPVEVQTATSPVPKVGRPTPRAPKPPDA